MSRKASILFKVPLTKAFKQLQSPKSSISYSHLPLAACEKPEGLRSENIQTAAQETEHKVCWIMKIYLGKDPEGCVAIEFPCLTEGCEVTHYELLSALTDT